MKANFCISCGDVCDANATECKQCLNARVLYDLLTKEKFTRPGKKRKP